MPTYQYACTECDNAFEQFQRFSDESLTECPACEGRLRKVFNAVGVVFKGSGFYRTDSRAGSGTSDGAASASGEGGSTKTEAKPASNGTGESGSTGNGGKAGGNGSGNAGKNGGSKPATTSSNGTPAS